MEFQPFIRRPFRVKAIQITDENIDEICKLIGTEVKQVKGGKCIVLDKRTVPNMTRAYVGWWVTRLGDRYRCYSEKIFTEQFILYTPEWASFFDDDTENVDNLEGEVLAVKAEDGTLVSAMDT